MAAQRLRKNLRTAACAKDAEKARKICGFGCGLAAIKRWRSGEKAAEKRLSRCGCKSMQREYLSSICCSPLRMTSHFFGHPLTRRSTGRSLSCNHNISVRGRTNEGCEAVAFGHPFPTSLGFVELPRISGHGESEIPSAPEQAGSVALVGTLRSLQDMREAPPRGAPLFW